MELNAVTNPPARKYAGRSNSKWKKVVSELQSKPMGKWFSFDPSPTKAVNARASLYRAAKAQSMTVEVRIEGGLVFVAHQPPTGAESDPLNQPCEPTNGPAAFGQEESPSE